MPTVYRDIFLADERIPKPKLVLDDEEDAIADKVPTPEELAQEPDVKALLAAAAALPDY